MSNNGDKKMNKFVKNKWFKPLLFLCLLGVVIGLAFAFNVAGAIWNVGTITFDLGVAFKLLSMLFEVLLVAALLQIVLGLIKPQNHRAKTILTITESVIKYLAALVILCAGLSIIGVNVSTIVASVGIVALIVGFGAESLIEDVVTGVFMLFENQYNVGDIIEVNGFRGSVSSIGIRTTCITDVSGNVKIINNAAMVSILNRSEKSSKAVSDIDVAYETDIEALEEKLPSMLEDIHAKHQDIFKSAPMYLGVQQLGASGVTLRFLVEVEEKDIYSGTRILNRELLVSFKKNNISIPFPQVDVHTKA